MPRKKTQDAPVPKTTVSADDFLAELEASEDALELDESEEVVTEEDIMAELRDGGIPASGSTEEPVPDVHAYPGLLPDTGNLLPLLSSIDAAVNQIPLDVASAIEILDKRVNARIDALGVTVLQLGDKVSAVSDVLKKILELSSRKSPEAPAAAERPVPASKPRVDSFVQKPVEKPASAVDAYMLKEIHAIVSAFPSGFKTDIPRLAKVIHAKRFAGDPAALPKVEVLCRDHLGALGSVKDGVFTRTASPPVEEDIEL